MRLFAAAKIGARTRMPGSPLKRTLSIFSSILLLTGILQAGDLSRPHSANAADTTLTLTQTLTTDYVNTSSKVWPVGVRACVSGLTAGQSYSTASSTFNWTTSGVGIDVIGNATQSLSAITYATPCVDIYYQIGITGTTPGTTVQAESRQYTVTVNLSGALPASGAPTPATHAQTTSTNRQIWVAAAINSSSQTVGDITVDTGASGAITLTVGNTYTFTVPADTGSNANAASINAYFDPKIFQIVSVSGTYSDNVTPFNGFFRNTCNYNQDRTSATYKQCASDTKFSATTSLLYKVKVIGLGSQTSIPTSVSVITVTGQLSNTAWKTYTKATSTGITSINTVWPLNLTVNGGSANASVSSTSSPVKVSGTGTSTGCSSYPCTVTANYTEGTVVTLTATTTDSNKNFVGWGGSCTGTALTCTVTMDAIQNVTASFGSIYPLSVTFTGTGYGSVTSDVGGISCSDNSSGATSGTCSTTFNSTGQVVVLSAVAAPGQLFTGWSGGCSSSTVATDKLTGSCTVTISASTTIQATFTAKPILSVKIGSNAAGPYNVTSDVGGISCVGVGDVTPNSTSGQCDAAFAIGSAVVLTANNVTASRPIWVISPASAKSSGCVTGTATCTLTISTDTVVNVTYAGMPLAVSIDSSKTGTGSVTTSDSTINCGDGYTACSYLYGTSPLTTTLTATAKTGSTFSAWSVTGVGGTVTLGTNCSGATGVCTVTWTSSTTSITVVAQFNASVTLTLSKSGAGSGTVTSTSGNINCGSTCSKSYAVSPYATETLTATPAVGSYFIGWSGGPCSGTSTCDVTVNDNINVIAQFGIARTITVSAGTGGSITPGTSSTVPDGSTPTYTITPDANYRIITATVDGVSVMSSLVNAGSSKTYTFSAVTTNHTIAATFSNTYSISVSYESNGSISYSGTTVTNNTSKTVTTGSTPTFTITPATGYHIATVTVDGNAVTPDGATATKTYTFSAVNSDMALAATFAIDTFTITASTPTNGSISPTGSTGISYGGSQQYTFTPATGYKVSSVVIDGVSQSWTQNTYSFTGVQADHTIAVTFTPITYTVTVSLTGSGTSSTNTGSVNYGSTPEYTFTPAAGYHIVAATLDGVDIMSSLVTTSGLAKKYSFAAIYADKTIAVTFSDKYAITVSSGANGSISPATSYAIVGGTTPTYTVTPATGYHVAGITVDGSAINLSTDASLSGKVYTYTFASISADHSISATFAIDTFNLVASVTGSGSISPSGTTSVNYNGNQTYTFTASSGYRVYSVKIDGNVQSPTPDSYSFTSVQAGHTIEVTFVAINYTLTANNATNIKSTTATIGGALNPDGDTPNAVTICWGSDTNLVGCTSVNVASQVADVTTSNNLTLNLTGLNPGSTYYYKVYATDSSGVASASSKITFKMSLAATQDASSIGINGATINGTFDSGSNDYATADITHINLCYSATKTNPTTLGGTPTCSDLWASGDSLANNTTKTVLKVVSGLDAGTQYHSQIQVTYSTGAVQVGLVKSFTTLPTPEASLVSPTSISSHKATIQGIVNPKNNHLNKVTFCWFEGSSLSISDCTASRADREDMDISISSWNGSSNNHQFTKALSNLKAKTTYSYLIFATSSNFVTASLVSAIVKPATVKAASLSSFKSTVLRNSTTLSSSPLSGLSTFTSAAVASSDIVYSSTGQFTTAGTSTEPATSIGSTAARINGNLYTPTGGLAAGDVSSINLCYATTNATTVAGEMNGTALSCGSNLWAGTTLAGGITKPYYVDLSGLSTQQKYYFQIKVAFTDGSNIYGSVLDFTTLASVAAPTVATTGATSIDRTSATINGTVNANNSTLSSVTFCWGTSSGLGTCTTINPSYGASLTDNLSLASALSGLQPGTTYYYKVTATNGQGSTETTAASFTTKIGVTYNKDSASSNSTGTAPTDSALYDVGATITVLGNTTNLSLTGAYFAGWSRSSAGTGTVYGPGFTTSYTAPAGDVVFYAKWTNYTVNFLVGDGSGTPPASQSGVITLPGIESMVAPAGKSFNGWNCGAEGAPFTPTANTDCTAVWVANSTYTVTYSANGATGGMIPADSNAYTAGSTITVLGNTGNLSLEGNRFAGWYLASDNTTLYGPTLTLKTYSAPSNNVTFYAKWIAYQVTFDKGSATGTAPVSQSGVINPMPGSTGMTAPADTTFGGWSCVPEGNPTGTVLAGANFTPSANTTCTAVWNSTLTTFTVFYSATLKSGGSLPANTVGNGNITLAQNTGGLYRNGYSFSGWTIQGNNYGAGATFNLTIDVTAEARWTSASSSSAPAPITYTITLFYVPGTSGPNTLTYTVGGAPLTLPNVFRKDYESLGWSSQQIAQRGVFDNYVPTKSENLYTVWRNLPEATHVYFLGDSPVLQAKEKANLKALAAKVLKNVQKPQLVVYGWVKETIVKSYDRKLSYARAVNTVKYLRSLGVNAYAKTTPKGISPENSPKSRRTDVRIFYSGQAVK